jgi:hypothetical protein
MRLTIRTRLMVLMLLTAIICSALLAILGSNHGKQTINKQIEERLIISRGGKIGEITTYLNSINNFIEVMGQNVTIANASKEFIRDYRGLSNNLLNADCSKDLNDYYLDFMDKLKKNMDVKQDVALYYPNTIEGCYLQYHYIIKNTNQENKGLMERSNETSAYGITHAKYHKFFHTMITKIGFEDAFIVDLEKGDIVYSVVKEPDFATNLVNGPHRNSNLAQLTQKLKLNTDVMSATWYDFAPYRPSLGASASFVGVPLTENGVVIGGLIFQISLNKINRILCDNYEWEKAGRGKKGEAYLVGSDMLMRSISRPFHQNKKEFIENQKAIGANSENIKNIEQYGTTILNQKIETDAVKLALNGKTGVKTQTSYNGKEAVCAYAPLGFKDLNWVLVTEKETSEAFIL